MTSEEDQNMKTMSGQFRAFVFAALLATGFVALPHASLAAPGAGQQDVSDGVKAKLNKSQFKDVQVSVDANGIATLSGTVGLYEYKADADKAAHKAKGVAAVRNLIEVGGTSVPDADLQKKLSEKLTYDRVGYGNVFDAISVQVHNGVATLGGHSHDYPNRDSALAVASTMPGVKDVVDEISVDPVSPNDDRIRIEVARTVYGFTSLNKYAMDPAKPIRVSVQNGNVALYGVVDSEADKDVANIQANTVPGVFSVKNYLQVANQPNEKQN
jgi:osmotically-inducible protein OsmY